MTPSENEVWVKLTEPGIDLLLRALKYAGYEGEPVAEVRSELRSALSSPPPPEGEELRWTIWTDQHGVVHVDGPAVGSQNVPNPVEVIPAKES